MWGKLRDVLVFAVLCGIVTAGGVGAIAGTAGGQIQEAPLADAGLDQTVPLGATVYLDGGGSVAPEGELVAFDWTVETPAGATTAHDCLDGDCVQASFDPSQTGVYTVTLTVTDDDGQTASDTLYVTVTEEEPPSVSLTGPDTLQVGETGTFELDGERGDNFLSAVTWRVDGDRADRFFVDDARTWEFTRAFDQPGTYTVSGTLADVIGLSATAEQTVEVESNTSNRFEVSLGTNSPVVEGETATITATIENVGEETATQEIAYEGPPADADRTVTLEGGSSTTETVEWETESGDAGEYSVTVSSRNDTAGGTIEVIDNTTDGKPYFDVEITDTNSPVEPGEQVRVDATITNSGTITETQAVEATVPLGEPTRRDVTLAPEESTDLVFTFDTDESDDVGEYTAEVSSDNASDAAQITLENASERIKVTELTRADQGWPDTKNGGLEFTAIVKNVGNASGSDTVTLRIPGEGLTIAKAQTDTLAPEPAGEDECRLEEDCAQILTAEDWEFVDVPEQNGNWAPDGDHGWWEYDNEMYWVHVITNTTSTKQYKYATPELPNFNITITETVTSGAIGQGFDKHGVTVKVQNSGTYKGKALVSVEQTQSFYEDGVDWYGFDCSPDCTIDAPYFLDNTYITVPAGGEVETGLNTLLGNTKNDYQAVYEVAVYKGDVRPDINADWSDHQIHDEETATQSWDDTTTPTDCQPNHWIEPEQISAIEGEKISYDVKVQTCDGDGNTVVETLDPSEYEVDQTANSLGPEYEINGEYVKIEEIPPSAIEGTFLGDWNVEILTGQLEGATAAAGAVWEEEEDSDDGRT